MRMITTSPNYRPIVGFLILVLAIAFFTGVLVGRSEPFNRAASSAERAQMAEDTRHQRELNQLDEERREARLGAEIELQQSKAKVQVVSVIVREWILNIGLFCLVVALVCGAGLATFRFVTRTANWAQPSTQPADAWQSPIYQNLSQDIAGIKKSLASLERRLDLSVRHTTGDGNGRRRDVVGRR